MIYEPQDFWWPVAQFPRTVVTIAILFWAGLENLHQSTPAMVTVTGVLWPLRGLA